MRCDEIARTRLKINISPSIPKHAVVNSHVNGYFAYVFTPIKMDATKQNQKTHAQRNGSLPSHQCARTRIRKCLEEAPQMHVFDSLTLKTGEEKQQLRSEMKAKG